MPSLRHLAVASEATEVEEEMILICTKDDLRSDIEPRSLHDLDDDAYLIAGHVEDVYFWRDGNVTPLKRRNAPLIVPEWLEGREGVDL